MDVDRIAEWLETLPMAAIHGVLFGGLLACGFGVPIPEDILLITGGYLAHLGMIDVHVFALIALGGVLIGDSTCFYLGMRIGTNLIRHRFLALAITPARIAKAQALLAQHGNRVFFIARFLPGLRAPIFLLGGSLGCRYRRFILYDGLAALISVPAWIYAAFFGGVYIDEVVRIGRQANLAFIGTVLLVILVSLVWRRRRQANVAGATGKV